jgi:hypothetical protein
MAFDYYVNQNQGGRWEKYQEQNEKILMNQWMQEVENSFSLGTLP